MRRSPKSESGCESYGLAVKQSHLTGLFSISGLDLNPNLNLFVLIAGMGRSQVYNLNPIFVKRVPIWLY